MGVQSPSTDSTDVKGALEAYSTDGFRNNVMIESIRLKHGIHW